MIISKKEKSCVVTRALKFIEFTSLIFSRVKKNNILP